LRNLVIVARVLQCSADWLYDGKGPKPTQEQLTYTAPNATAMEIKQLGGPLLIVHEDVWANSINLVALKD
jgi:hypothetical protein